MDNKLSTALKINKFLKNGYVPNRGLTPYSESTKSLANCFEHACFNFPNSFLENFDRSDRNAFSSFLYPEISSSISNMKEFLKQTGLTIEEDNNLPLNANQWKIAIYFSTVYDNQPWEWQRDGDFHLMLQEKDGSWSNKFGNQKDVITFDKLPETFSHGGQTYRFRETLTLTNPYSKE